MVPLSSVHLCYKTVRVDLGFHFSSVLVPLLLQKSGAGARNVYVYLNGMSVFMLRDFL